MSNQRNPVTHLCNKAIQNYQKLAGSLSGAPSPKALGHALQAIRDLAFNLQQNGGEAADILAVTGPSADFDMQEKLTVDTPGNKLSAGMVIRQAALAVPRNEAEQLCTRLFQLSNFAANLAQAAKELSLPAAVASRRNGWQEHFQAEGSPKEGKSIA